MQQLPTSLGAVQIAFAVFLSGAGVAEASFISTAKPPDLFPVGSVFGGVPPICVVGGPLDGVCASDAKETILSSTVSFSGGNEYVVLNARLTGDTSSPAGMFSLLGSEDLTLIGRSDPSELGSFNIDVTYEDFVGSFFGQPLELAADPAGPHDGLVTVSSLPQFPGYLIDASLNVGTVLVADGVTTPIGVISTTASVPEPATWAMVAAGFLGLGFVRFRARPARASTA